MESPMACVEGRYVSNATLSHDYAQLAFGPNIGLSIYNKFNIRPNWTTIFDLDGKLVLKVKETKIAIVLFFSDKTELEIGMRDCCYNGPEALQLIRSGYPPVIWN